ncbi:hypothetical protein [Methyloversatilis sp.]|uniref:hypothetical protein n=1 Tax=Methyloversatilis sp. TaxID=2569862 RepID=UPI0035B340DD
MKFSVCFIAASVVSGLVAAAEPLSPLGSPSLYENPGVVGSIDTASGAIMINGQRYKANAKTLIYGLDSNGRSRRLLKLADIPANSAVSFSAGADGTITQIRIGTGIQPYRP